MFYVPPLMTNGGFNFSRINADVYKRQYKGRAQELELPSAPKQFLHYFTEPDRPQIKSCLLYTSLQKKQII